MNAQVKNLIITGAMAALLIPTTAFAQRSGGGVVGDARLHPGNWGGSTMRSSSTYRSTASAVRSESASAAVAQVPTERRSYSYEPAAKDAAAKNAAPKKATSPCVHEGSVKSEKSAGEKKSTDSRRSFSYEPATNEAPAPTASYSAPRMRTFDSSPWQRSTGSKADRNNQRN